jgi:hypothetical protein
VCTYLFQSFPSSFSLATYLYYISSYTELCSLPLPGYLKLLLSFFISHVSLSIYLPTELDVNLLSSYEVPIYLSFPQRKGAVHFLSSQPSFSSFTSQLPFLRISYLLSPKLLYCVYVSLSFTQHHVLCTAFLLVN